MKKHVNNTLEYTSALINRFNTRAAGSPESLGCADAIAADSEAYADKVITENFTFNRGAFLGWIRILVAAYTLSLVFIWLRWFTLSSFVLVGAILILVFQFFLYKELVDPLYPKAKGRNVLASLEPDGEVRGELMISGHHDSARIFNFLDRKPELYSLKVNSGIGSLLAMTLVSIILLIITQINQAPSWSWIASLAFTATLPLVIQLWFFSSKQHTPGAGDNLVSTAAAFEYLKICAGAKSRGEGFQHLRITAVSWDAEEEGLRGSRAWRKNIENAPQEIPVWNLNLECLYNEDELFLMTSDINGSVQLSSSLAKRCARILKNNANLDVPIEPIGFLAGGTDAGEVAKTGAEATTLMGMPFTIDKLSAVYHTPRDTIDSVSPEAVEAALILAANLAGELEKELGAG